MIKAIIVDDELPALSIFIQNVMDMGDIEYQVFSKTPMLAVDYVEKNHTNLAFLDIDMPQVNGVDLAMMLIEKNPSISIVFITAYAYNEREIKQRLQDNLLGYCHKPYDGAELINYIEKVEMAKEKNSIAIKTLGNFDVFINNIALRFACAKSKEMLALLVYKDGSTMNIDEIACYLWQDKDGEKAKRVSRDAVWKLKQTLRDYGIERILNFSRGSLSLNKSAIKSCDSWNVQKLKIEGVGIEYFSQYKGDWELYD